MKAAAVVAFVAPVVAPVVPFTQAQVGAYGQCGGNNYSGSTTCIQGFECHAYSEWYSQCVPSTGSPSTAPPTTAKPTQAPTTTKATTAPTTTKATPVPTTSTSPVTSTPTTSSPPVSTPGSNPKLPSSFQWTSTGPLISAKNDGRNIKGIKDPTVVQINGTYHVFASTASEAGYNLVYLKFEDPAKAQQADFFYLDQAPLGYGYRAAPEVFYFAPQKLWYLIFQDGNAAYSTNPDINNPAGWTAPKQFYNGTPKIIQDNLAGGYWVDMFVICDTANCYLFSSDDNGHLYQSSTPIESFPNGMSDPIILLQDTANKFALYEASAIYTIGTNQYLMLVEAIGSDGNRYFRSWTASSIAGPWKALADTEANPFARSNSVAFPDGAWTKSISHGELVRTQPDQTIFLDLCEPIRFLYQGVDPSSNADYNALPWQLGLLTQVGAPTC
ncbi:unnamed protein product [Aphanomyces euteiches]|uniref:non-reducing end alpha-L-arabinofuranosidase n=1 Tax=Aphanomyces euteiches TaxID=100861 RepID=A0A6G0WNX2_9STRA|nr:hypothetical protein Ae201684_013346 [Aphanomyces euteiches]KAH9064917.1 hypothetical protein Ae201684P_003696 [Aphanomyces euteiches]